MEGQRNREGVRKGEREIRKLAKDEERKIMGREGKGHGNREERGE